MRLRLLALAIAASAVVPLAPAGPAAAAGTGAPLTASISCDSAANTISTRVSGGSDALVPNYKYTLEIVAYDGSQVTTAGRIGVIAAKGQSVTVPVTSAADATVSAVGYLRSWPAADYVFYTETVRLLVHNVNGTVIATRDGTCTRDLRTTVRLDCDQAAQTITSSAVATGFPSGRTVRVQYWWMGTQQNSAGGNAFTRWYVQNSPDASHDVTASGDGTWSDIGYAFTRLGDPYYLDHKVMVKVRDLSSGIVIGQGDASCVYSDHRP